MTDVRTFFVLVCTLLLTLTVGVCVAGNAASATKSSSQAVSKTAAKAATTQKTTGQQAKKASAKSDVLARAEELSGTVSFISPSDKEVTLIGANGVPYDFDLTRSTSVELAGKRVKPSELTGEKEKQATVRFLPTARGNMAQSVEVSSS